jgi:hypothetical protein
MSNTPRPVLVMNGVLAGLGVILGGAALGEYVDLKLVGLLLLVHSGVSVSWALITQQAVTPNPLVGARLERIDGETVMVAADATREISNGRPVDVTLANDPGWLPPDQDAT